MCLNSAGGPAWPGVAVRASPACSSSSSSPLAAQHALGDDDKNSRHSPRRAPRGAPRFNPPPAEIRSCTRGRQSSASARSPVPRRRAKCRRAERPRRDAQASVPSAWRPRAQLAFKDSMVRRILPFTPRITFRYVLHRCESQDIRCRESCDE